MKLEEKIREELHSAAEVMGDRIHHFPDTLNRAKRERRTRRGMLIGIAAVVGLLGFWGASLLTTERAGITLPPARGDERAFSNADAEETARSFVAAIINEDRGASWEMLTLRAKQRLGPQERWAQIAAELRAEISWIDDRNDRSWITMIPGRDPETYLVTFTAEPENGSAYLEVFTLEASGDRLGVDLKRRNDISLQPEAPVFRACSPPCDPEEMWPEVGAGDTFSVLLERMGETFTTTIDRVWFTVGANGWVGQARLIEGAKSVRAMATFDPQVVVPGENAFTVTIETSDGVLETYGYRVIYEPD